MLVSEKTAIKVDNVSKDFLLPHERTQSIKSAFIGVLGGQHNKTTESQHALKGISFEVKKGEFFGIVGRNGSGKSTLLKILAGIYQPTKGRVSVDGKLVPFIELGVGFNPELTGRENVYLNGALLGLSKVEIDATYEEVVEFAELKEFMDQRLKNYSSGMQVRLAFSCSTMVRADILLIDEVLAVGDADFQRKCFNYFKKLKNQATTVVFVTHDMSAVKEYCDRAILVNNGIVQLSGTTDDVAEEYTKLFNNTGNTAVLNNEERWGNKDIKITLKPEVIVKDDKIEITAKLSASNKILSAVVGLSLSNESGVVVVGTNTKIMGLKVNINKSEKIKIVVPNIFSSGSYTVTIAIHSMDGVTVYDWWNSCASFQVENTKNTPYAVSPKCTILIGK